MLLNVAQQKTVVLEEVKLLVQLRYKLNNQLRKFKQIQHLTILRKHINNLFKSLNQIESYNPKQGGKITDLRKFISESTNIMEDLKSRIKNHGIRVSKLLEDGKFLQAGTIIFGSISRIYSNLQIIQTKVEVISNAINKLKEQKTKLKQSAKMN